MHRGTITTAAIALAAALTPAPAAAYEIESGIENLEGTVNVDLRYNTGVRVEKRDERLARTPLFDEGDLQVKRGGLVTNRFDAVGGFTARYTPEGPEWIDNFGLRVSGSSFIDFANHDRKLSCRDGDAPVGVPPGLLAEPGLDLSALPGRVSYCDPRVTSYGNGKRNDFAQKRAYQDSEILDLFAFGNFRAGDVPISLKVGSFSLYWGESILNPLLGVAYSMGPIDLNKVYTVPGINAQDVFLPIQQVAGTIGVLDTLSIGFDVPLEWDNIRAPEGGTYMSPADPFFDGPSQFFIGNLPGVGPTSLLHAPSIEGKNKGAFGLQLKWSPEFLDGGAIGAYYRTFDDVLPWLGLRKADPGQPGPLGDLGAIVDALAGLGITLPEPLPAEIPGYYRYTYARDSKLYGLTGSYKAFGISWGADLVYMPNRALNSQQVRVYDDGQAARGQVWSTVVNGLYLGKKLELLGATIWDTYLLIAEINGSYLQQVTSHADAYKKVGSDACRADLVVFGGGNGNAPGKSKGGTTDSCSSRYAIGASLLFSPTWYQVWPGIDLTASFNYSTGIKNNSPAQLGGNEGFASGSLGLTANFYQKWTAGLAYNYYDSQYRTGTNFDDETVVTSFNGLGVLADRDWVSLTLKYSF